MRPLPSGCTSTGTSSPPSRRALSPHIGAWTTMHGRRVTIWRARLEGGELVPVEVQPEGRGRMQYEAFLRGIRT
jgi:methionyl-tRNA formyltransferase